MPGRERRRKKKGLAGDPRSKLLFTIFEHIRAELPRVFIVENAEGIMSTRDPDTGEADFRRVDCELKKDGRYKVYRERLNTEDHGVPQHRRRIYWVGILK